MDCNSGNMRGVQTYLSSGANVNTVTTFGSMRVTALHMASQAGKEDIVRYLLQQGADPRIAAITADDKCSALHMTCENGHEKCVAVILVRILI